MYVRGNFEITIILMLMQIDHLWSYKNGLGENSDVLISLSTVIGVNKEI